MKAVAVFIILLACVTTTAVLANKQSRSLRQRVIQLENQIVRLEHRLDNAFRMCDCRITCLKVLGHRYRGSGGMLDDCLTECRVNLFRSER